MLLFPLRLHVTDDTILTTKYEKYMLARRVRAKSAQQV
jgi:hypothetical protein